jgi:DNA-binding SARP family transcriptional activator
MQESTLPSLIGRITVLNGETGGHRFTVERFPALVGRGDDCEVCLQDPVGQGTISRRHARLSIAGGRLSLEDLSTNGTRVAGTLLHRGEARVLNDSEEVWFGPNLQVRIETVRTWKGDPDPVSESPPAPSSEALTRLRLVTLGDFQAYWDDQPIPRKAWETRKPIVLLAYLAWHDGRVVSAERLCNDLWPDHPQGGRQALQSTLARIRRALRPTEPVLFEHGSYRLNPALGLDFDVARLQHASRDGGNVEEGRRQSLETVRELYRGPFLEGFSEDWACLRRQDLEQQFQECMAELGQLLNQNGQHREALDVFREVLQLEPCWEPGHQGILEGLVQLGQRDDAVRHYHRYVETVKSQLNLSPSPDMLRLYYGLLDAK